MERIHNKKTPTAAHGNDKFNRRSQEVNVRFIMFIRLLRYLELYSISYDGESLYWEYMDKLGESS